MKRINLAICTSLAVLLMMPLIFNGCKKGSGDPFLSLRSRKARVAGEWKVTKLSLTINTSTKSILGDVSTTVNSSVNDGIATTITSTTDNLSPIISKVSETFLYTFNKDGSFKGSFKNNGSGSEQVTKGNFGDQYLRNYTFITTNEYKGTWDFLSGVGKDKNKENMRLIKTDSVSTTVYSSTFTAIDASSPAVANSTETVVISKNPYSEETWKLSELRNKKIKATGSSHSVTTQTYNGSQSNTDITQDTKFSIELDPK